MEKVDCVVIGAGVVGLAVARRLALAGAEVIVLEAGGLIGNETSSRNSEVIHAGIYYPHGSWKHRMCVAGRTALYPYLESRGVAHRRCGKLIAATSAEQIDALKALRERARQNGVDDLQWLDRAATRALEPALECVAGLLSPSTGIIDSHGFMLALQGDAEAAGAVIAFHSPVVGGTVGGERTVLRVGGPAPLVLECRSVVNAAGLGAQSVATGLKGFPAGQIPPRYYAKGNYFVLNGRSPFNRLIYPMPDSDSLGVHVTLDLAGRVRFGPDVEWVDAPDYQLDAARAERFYAAIRHYWPGLPDAGLEPGYVGVRPKLVPQGAPAGDFMILGPESHGVGGLVHLFGIESPGLTSALAIADRVAQLLGHGNGGDG